MDRLQAMRVFVTVVDLGSQSAAADHLDLSRPVVSRFLAELEDWVGARLMHRTTRKLSLTAAGAEMLPRCRQMLELCNDMQAAVSESDEAPRGQLRLSVSSSFGQAQLAAAVVEYVKLYPLVSIDMQMLDRTVNLVDERIDLAIRTSFELDPNLIARKLTLCRSVICASPGYLLEHPQPRQVRDLAEHNCLTHSYFGKSLWHFTENGEPVSVAVQGSISANEASTLLRVTLAGAGVARLPSYQAGDYIRRGELVRLLPEAEPQQMHIYAVYASRKHMPLALRSLLDFLVLRFPQEPVWDIGL
ncbi:MULTISPECIES: LysR family transcriptional regulator [Pseudomonas]|jgi:DNA-binding transcriptional LysR family regulator|uniref:DNA-binding transcriptional regulator, LysR family n=2 Tax=Pseudomonas fluorescens TaxID=294 RepID=A0ABY1TEU3_PSEFL|nr:MULTISPECIES: LysR family transcriptional regulator [Pseudomonas]MBC8786482.1 LysR family transcriptional regulator [Pseudomonas fluorescens]MCI4605425.1 LysR family transcriptional regulator [Pseudomonas fluorescens]NNB69905.1 LysR family transcriptional regulator [Pseudomonas fluorescens]OEC68430.1 LysR family transcriptional regulator [Pseudomonas sp. AP19]PQB00253.1 LysR family transcriptional regulator [Pseudomonas fluorescens]